jgi:exosortase/archaeosortase family protein
MTAFSISSRNLRTLCAAGFVAAAVLLAQSQDALREITRPIVLGILQAFGMKVEDKGDLMMIGHLEVPWTRDCAGMNLLLIMLALAVWVNREEPVVLKFWLRVAAMVPAALAANVLRVLSLIGYRMIAYPAVESPQTHYFLGFIWMVPFITLITPRAGRPAFSAFLETLHAAAVVALLTPMTGMPNGSLLAIAVVLALSQCRVRDDLWKWRLPLTGLWIVAGIAVALTNMESFWLPWLLCCPLLLDLKWLFSPAGILVMLCTHSMFMMQSWSPPVAWLGIGLVLWSWLKKSPAPEPTVPATHIPTPSAARRTLTLGTACCFLIPFLASTLLSIGEVRWKPPVTVQSRPLDTQGFEVLLPGQPENIALACYGAEGNDRHHTVQVCLKYRGTELTANPENPAVYTDGKHWLREFFLQDGKLLADYPAYLKSTFAPGSDPGVHLIFISPMDSGTPQAFAIASAGLAESFHHLCLGDSPALSRKSQ